MTEGRGGMCIGQGEKFRGYEKSGFADCGRILFAITRWRKAGNAPSRMGRSSRYHLRQKRHDSPARVSGRLSFRPPIFVAGTGREVAGCRHSRPASMSPEFFQDTGQSDLQFHRYCKQMFHESPALLNPRPVPSAVSCRICPSHGALSRACARSCSAARSGNPQGQPTEEL